MTRRLVLCDALMMFSEVDDGLGDVDIAKFSPDASGSRSRKSTRILKDCDRCAPHVAVTVRVSAFQSGAAPGPSQVYGQPNPSLEA